MSLHISLANRCLCLFEKLLDRNQASRLGSNGDVEEVKAHPFFADINWDALYNRQIDAEYKPAVSEEQKQQEQRLLSPSTSAEQPLPQDDGQSAQPGHMGHSIMEEDAKEEMTPSQVEYVRQH